MRRRRRCSAADLRSRGQRRGSEAAGGDADEERAEREASMASRR
jgi:hypothetical protein